MCHNPGTWHNSSQVKLTTEESCQSTNCKAKYKNNCEQLLCQSHLGTIVPVSLGNNFASFSWDQLCQCLSGAVKPVSLGDNFASVTCVQ